MSIKCKVCGTMMPDDMKFCTHCGNRLEVPAPPPAPAADRAGKTCPRCHSTVDSRYRFCTECGFDFETLNASPAPVEPVNGPAQEDPGAYEEAPAQPEPAAFEDAAAQTGPEYSAGTPVQPAPAVSSDPAGLSEFAMDEEATVNLDFTDKPSWGASYSPEYAEAEGSPLSNPWFSAPAREAEAARQEYMPESVQEEDSAYVPETVNEEKEVYTPEPVEEERPSFTPYSGQKEEAAWLKDSANEGEKAPEPVFSFFPVQEESAYSPSPAEADAAEPAYSPVPEEADAAEPAYSPAPAEADAAESAFSSGSAEDNASEPAYDAYGPAFAQAEEPVYAEDLFNPEPEEKPAEDSNTSESAWEQARVQPSYTSEPVREDSFLAADWFTQPIRAEQNDFEPAEPAQDTSQETVQEEEQVAGQEPASMQPVSKTKICRNCGEKIDIGDIFCIYCGTRQEPASAQTPAAAPAEYEYAEPVYTDAPVFEEAAETVAEPAPVQIPAYEEPAAAPAESGYTEFAAEPYTVSAPEQAAVTEDVFAEPAAAPAAENEPVWSLEQEDDTVYVPSWSSFEPISAAEPAPAQEAVFEETAEAAAEIVPSQETVFEEPAPQPAPAPFDVTEETETAAEPVPVPEAPAEETPSPVKMEAVCPVCGSIVPSMYAFCIFCGSRMPVQDRPAEVLQPVEEEPAGGIQDRGMDDYKDAGSGFFFGGSL